MNVFFGLIYFLLLFGAIVFLAYVSTKFIGTRASSAAMGKYLRVIDTISLGLDKQIYLVKVGEQLFLVSSSNKNVQFLSLVDHNKVKLDPQDVLQSIPENKAIGNNLFGYYLNIFRKKEQKDSSPKPEIIEMPVNKFNQNLDRIKGIFSEISIDKNGDGKQNE
jgi:flagellar protein FliO/FliZ